MERYVKFFAYLTAFLWVATIITTEIAIWNGVPDHKGDSMPEQAAIIFLLAVASTIALVIAGIFETENRKTKYWTD